MKKVYCKPDIAFEDFAISTNIAGNCGEKIGPSTGVCAYTYEDEFLGKMEVFVEGISNCVTKEADGEYNGLCYHVPTGNSMFNS